MALKLLSFVLVPFALLLLAYAEIDPSDQQNLIAVYEGFNEKGFLQWNTSTDLCSQSGIRCSNDVPQRVISLILTDNNLYGTISGQLGNLAKLKGLYLNNNHLTSTLPTEIGLLSDLEFLHLTLNNLFGTIPKELSSLRNLKSLYLNFNSFSGTIPSSFGQLSNLEDLLLETNNLSGEIPSTLGNLKLLTFFKASSNKFTGTLPSELASLSLLEELSLHDNHLSGAIPKELLNLRELESLYLASNNFNCPVWDYSVFPQNDYRLSEDICINALPPSQGWIAIASVLTCSVFLLVVVFVGVIFFRRTRAALDGYSEIQEAEGS